MLGTYQTETKEENDALSYLLPRLRGAGVHIKLRREMKKVNRTRFLLDLISVLWKF